MGVLYFPTLTNFIEYDTDSAMQEAEMNTIIPGAVVFSKESNKAYQFINANIITNLSSDSLPSDTGEGYWVPLASQYIYEEDYTITPNLKLNENTLFVGNSSNIATQSVVTGILNLQQSEDTVSTTLNLNENTLFVGNSLNIATQSTVGGILEIQQNGSTVSTALKLNENYLLVGNSSNLAVGSNPTGVLSFSQSETSVDISLNDEVVSINNLTSGIQYSGIIVLLAQYMNSSGTSTSYVLSASGILSSDYPFISMGSEINSGVQAWIVLSDDSITLNFSDIPGPFTVNIQVCRDIS